MKHHKPYFSSLIFVFQPHFQPAKLILTKIRVKNKIAFQIKNPASNEWEPGFRNLGTLKNFKLSIIFSPVAGFRLLRTFFFLVNYGIMV